ncbi:MAG: hypothetical protein L6V93_17780 [Clostridiales bacterium]|nr:MAG: hypothetical protein L6V93_17780 [Clostridiales bacterium]
MPVSIMSPWSTSLEFAPSSLLTDEVCTTNYKKRVDFHILQCYANERYDCVHKKIRAQTPKRAR